MKKLFISLGLVIVLHAALASAAQTGDELKLYIKQGDRSPTWNELVESGFKAFDSDNLPTALVFLDKAYALGCRDGMALYRLASIHESRGNAVKAVELMEEARPRLKKDYASTSAAKNVDAHLGRLYFETDHYDKALPLLAAAVKTEPDNFTLHFIAGQVMRHEARLQEAYDLYKRALTLTPPEGVTATDPKLAVVKELMAVTYEMKRYDESLACAEQILAVDPKNALALSYKNRIGQIQMLHKQDDSLQKLIEQYK